TDTGDRPMCLRHVFALAVALAAAGAAGCGNKPKLVRVTGKGGHKGQGGTPGSIWFHPPQGNAYKGKEPRCQLGTGAALTQPTYPWGDGVPPGSYKVTLSPELATRLGKKNYGDAAKTPWTIDVPEDGLTGKEFEVK